MIMPFTYSITNGIGFGFIAYVLIRIAQGQWRRVHLLITRRRSRSRCSS
jgi:adenine/guanine/hypoxanthine permease